MTYTAASQQGVIETFWLHFRELSGCPSFLQSMVSEEKLGVATHRIMQVKFLVLHRL